MEGYQFAHMEVYSAKGRTAAGPEDQHGKKKNGQRAWTAQEIIDELERLEHASRHVIADRPAPEIFPGAVDNFSDLRKAQIAAASVKEKFPYTGKDGTRSMRQRKLRADAASIYASVVSLPVRTEEALQDDDLKSRSVELLNESIDHERRRLEKAGGRYMMGVVHWDEEYLHVHIIALEPELGRVDHLHPGRAAKKRVFEESQGQNLPKKEVNKLGNAAYCDAMRAWQTDFYEEVFRDAGLLRVGPRRERMSRAEYKRMKEAAGLRSEDEERRAGLERWDADVSDRAEMVRIQEDDIAEKMTRAEHLRETAERKNAEAAEAIERSEAREASAAARADALDAGTTAVLERQIAYRPKTKERPEGLQYGPTAPEEKSERRKLSDRILPAFDGVMAFARRFAAIERREQELQECEDALSARSADLRQREVEQRAEEQRQEAQAAHLGWRARMIAKAGRKLREFVPKGLHNILEAVERGEEPDLSKGIEMFPDAYGVSKETDRNAVQKQLDAMSNAGLARCFSATQDAYLLSESDETLQSTFGMGVRVLAFEARQRGVDFETGRYDPSKAENPKRATLHTDTPHEAIRVRRAVRDRQLVR